MTTDRLRSREDATPLHQTRRPVHEAAAPAPAGVALETPPAFVRDPQLRRRGNGPVLQTLLLGLQQTRGNRFLQRTLQGAGRPPTATPLAVQREEDGESLLHPPGGAHPTLHQGSNGPSVRELQTKLNAAGATPPLAADGLFGPQTQAAVTAFQQAHGLVPDAVVGPQTWAALDGTAAPGPDGRGLETLDRGDDLSEFGLEPAGPGGLGGNLLGTPAGGAKQSTGAAVCVGGDCVGEQRAADQQTVIQSAMHLNPAGHDANVLFDRLLHPPTAPDDTVTIHDLANVLIPAGALAGVEASPVLASAGGPTAGITPGDPARISGLLMLLDLAVADAGTRNVFQGDGQARTTERINNLILFYQARANATTPLSADRQRVISIALSQVGIVQDRAPAGLDPADPRKRQFRTAHDRLNEYFATAFGGENKGYSKDLVDHIPARLLQTGDPATDPLPEWCGIFPLWAYRSAGMSVGTWQTGHSIPAVAGFKPITAQQVQPGDVGVENTALSHEFIIVDVLADQKSFVTVEGNTNAAGSGTGGEVAQHSGKRSKTNTTFYRPDGLV